MFTMLVLMAITTTALTAPILWIIWLRHHNLPAAQENPFIISENYLSLALDREYLDQLDDPPVVDIEDMVHTDSNNNIEGEQPQQRVPSDAVDYPDDQQAEYVPVATETSHELQRVLSSMRVSNV